MKTAKQPAAPIRKLMVCCKDSRKRTDGWEPLCSIGLKGYWLTRLGFYPGDMVDILCETGKLTISINNEQQDENE
ncbi:SymE family type I addiction module toxin [Taibaiella chishuiensis]|uniref:Type I toxin-antitoxin system toxin SymE n=1 Tax=Taibaiella chishuiensis TaxID=1434707 RepID=A0A2P8CY96_9BACT|nr:SymE family type I addiction module toxin [Taibaiella chishuiensis]PSK89886.1 type I toxin-antitoxin system toxin SymE [Taibaiella chishuiensis]